MASTTLQSLERGLDLLFLFSAERPTLSLPEIATALGLTGSTAYRLVTTCCRKNVLTGNPRAKRYELHASLLRFQHVLRLHLGIRRITLPHLDELAALSSETSQLSLLQGNAVVCAEAVRSRNTIRFMPERGRAIPLHASALGRAVLGFLPASILPRYIEQVGLPAMTPYTITVSRCAWRRRADLRAQRCGHCEPGYLWPHPRFTDRKAKALVPALSEHAPAISAMMRELSEHPNEGLTSGVRRAGHGGTDWRPRP